MEFRRSLLLNAVTLPAYWKECRLARGKMTVSEEHLTYGKDRRQYAIVVRGAGCRPGRYAFYFHGGAWTFGRPETFVPAAGPWLEQGYTVVLPSYRRPPVVGMHGIVADCRAAIAAVAGPETTTHLHVGGISAGAHLAALLALRPTWWHAAGWAIAPQKALLCAGPLVLADLKPRAIFRPYAAYDPFGIPVGVAHRMQWQLLHGTDDALVSHEHSRKFYDKLTAAGQVANLMTLPGGTHLDSGRWMFGGVGEQRVKEFLGE